VRRGALAGPDASVRGHPTAGGYAPRNASPSELSTRLTTEQVSRVGDLSDLLFAKLASDAGARREAERERPAVRALQVRGGQGGDARRGT
jgi:hypothetical protein